MIKGRRFDTDKATRFSIGLESWRRSGGKRGRLASVRN